MLLMRARLRRSALYVPGSNARALEKARSLPADVILFDCEDAVAPGKKQLAREQIAEVMEAGGYGRREKVVRVNSLTSAWGEDDVRICARHADAVLLPKAESVHEVERLSELLGEVCNSAQTPAIWCMIETSLGVLRADSIAAIRHVECLVAGTSDLSADLRLGAVCAFVPKIQLAALE